MLQQEFSGVAALREQRTSSASAKRAKYQAPDPASIERIDFDRLLTSCGRSVDQSQGLLFKPQSDAGFAVRYAGNLALLNRPAVSVIGARAVSEQGARRALKLARELAAAGVTVVSGLAKGVDRCAHEGALSVGGATVAVIGTPIERCYPAEHAGLQETIYRDHLLVSQFEQGARTFPSDFPKRNRLMAALTDASVIVEASDSSGTLHQAVECVRLNRWLFIMRSLLDDPKLEWPHRFLNEPRVRVLSSTDEILSVVARHA